VPKRNLYGTPGATKHFEMCRLEQLLNLMFGERGCTSHSAVRLRDLVERDCYQKVRVSRQKLNKKSHDVLYRLTHSPTRVLWPNHWEITLDCKCFKTMCL
jgi:hypothetical protein